MFRIFIYLELSFNVLKLFVVNVNFIENALFSVMVSAIFVCYPNVERA